MSARPITDAVFRAFATETRRHLLAALQAYDVSETTDVFTLLDEIDSEHRKDTMSRMHHADLPLLNDLGYIRWDATTNEVGKGVRFAELTPILSLEQHHFHGTISRHTGG